MPWFKLDCGWWLSEWILPLSSESQLCWIRLLEHVKEKGNRGTVKAISPMVASRIWMVGEESVRKLLEAAQASGALSVTDGDWTVTKWIDYQTDPNHAERQAEYRERQKSKTKRQVGDGDVTARDSHYPSATASDDERRGEENRGEQNRTEESKTKSVVDLIDVVEFASQIGKSQDEAARFYAAMASDGWQVSGEPVRNWKGLFRTWAPPLRVEPGGKPDFSITVDEAERLREGGPPPGSESPFAKLKREMAEKAGAGDPA